MILQKETPKEIKTKFLSNNPKVHEIQDKNAALGDFFSLDDDEEVWIMQCPKGLPPSLIQSEKIRLPGRSSKEELETLAFEFSEPVPHAFAQKNKKGHNSVKILPVKGSIVLRNRLHTVIPPDLTETKTPSELVPMPMGIKERHPLHGVDYESKLEISPQIAERLKQADEASAQPRKSKKKKSKKPSKEASTIPVDSDGEVELVMQKKPKKKKNKRKHSDSDAVDEVPTKKKEKKKSLSEDVAEDLQWLQKL